MKICAIEHMQMAMPPNEEEQARAFYGKVLGIPEIPKPADLALRGGAWFEQGALNVSPEAAPATALSKLKIHLGVEKDFRPASKAHPALLVEGLDDLSKRCEQLGHAVISDEPLEGYHRVYVSDPFGNRIELMEPI